MYIFYDIYIEYLNITLFCRVYYKRTGVDPDVDFVQETIKKPSELGYSDWETKNGKMVKVIKIDPRYYFTTYETKIQVFNEMCEEPWCEGPMSDPVEVYSAEDLPQVRINSHLYDKFFKSKSFVSNLKAFS